MTLRSWFMFISAACNLSLAALAFGFAGGSTLRWPVVGLGLSFFGASFAPLIRRLVGVDGFALIDSFFTATIPLFAFACVSAFVGRTRPLRVALYAHIAWFGSLALLAAVANVSETARAFVQNDILWATCFLVGWLPSMLASPALLIRHWMRSADEAERGRTRLLLLALIAATVLGIFDIARYHGLQIPPLGALGMSLCAMLMSAAVVRYRLFDRDLRRRTVLSVFATVVSALGSYVFITVASEHNRALGVFLFTTVSIGLAALGYELMRRRTNQQANIRELALVGRMSRQLAHDLKTPLAALLGGASVIERARSAEEALKFAQVVSEQAKRVATMVETYERLTRIEPVFTTIRLNELGARVACAVANGIASNKGVTIEMDLGSLELNADATLVESALENVLRNAVEASRSGTMVRMRSEQARGGVVLSVVDHGEGMDARQVERAFLDFFTTKTTGSGLGLAFVKRVLLAHGGTAALRSTLGKGTVVELWFPEERGR